MKKRLTLWNTHTHTHTPTHTPPHTPHTKTKTKQKKTLFTALRKVGINEGSVQLFEDIYTNVTAKFHIENDVSKATQNKKRR